jgi:hypothetical protein
MNRYDERRKPFSFFFLALLVELSLTAIAGRDRRALDVDLMRCARPASLRPDMASPDSRAGVESRVFYDMDMEPCPLGNGNPLISPGAA